MTSNIRTNVVYLQADEEFVEILSKIRNGTGTSLVKGLQARCSESVDKDGIIATRVTASQPTNLYMSYLIMHLISLTCNLSVRTEPRPQSASAEALLSN